MKIVSCSRAMPATTTAPVTPLESYAQERGAMTTKERPSPSPLPRKAGMESEAISNATLVEPPKRSGTVKPRTTHLVRVRVRGRGRGRGRVSEDHPPAVPLDQVDLGRQARAREQHQRHLVRVRVTVRVRVRVRVSYP